LGHDLGLLDPGDCFNVELDLEGLEKIATKKRKVRECVEEYTLDKGKRTQAIYMVMIYFWRV
jgi:S-adenosylhomocysteine hydrolase